MHVACKLRTIREQLRNDDGSRVSLTDIAKASGVSAGVLSQIERGIYLPTDQQISQLEQAYGAEVTDWYPPRVLLLIEADAE